MVRRINMWNNVDNVYCKPWLVLPTVYADALSYSEQLNKFCYVLNQLIENNNQLPEYIENLVKQYFEGGAIGDEVKQILSTYMISVKFPPNGLTPAVGDGTADDTATIQGCIDYAESIGGGIVFFPSGVYLTDSLTLKNNVGLFGMGRYGTRIVLKGGETAPLLTSNASGHSIVGLTFDCNSEVQVNDINTLVFTGDNLSISDCLIKGGNYALSYTGGGVFDINHVYFDSAIVYGLVVSGNASVTANSLYFKDISAVSGKAAMSISSNEGYYSDIVIAAKVPVGVECDGNNNMFKVGVSNATTDYTDEYSSNSWDIANKVKVERYENVQTNISGGVVENGNHLEENYAESTENITGTKNISSKELILNTTSPLTYKKPDLLDNFFKSVDFKDTNGEIYKVLVYYKNLENLVGYVTPEDFGAVGDGITDDTAAIIGAINTEKIVLLSKKYKISSSITPSVLVGTGELIYTGNDTKYVMQIENHYFVLLFGISVTINNGCIGAYINNCNNAYIINCVFKNADNGSRTISTSGITIFNANYSFVYNNTITNINRTNINPGTISSTGINVNSVTCVIKHNIIEKIICKNESTDCDGIYTQGNTAIISENIVKKCTGRFIKMQSINNKVNSNTLSNNDFTFTVGSYFFGIDNQNGTLTCIDNRIDIGNSFNRNNSKAINVTIPANYNNLSICIKNNTILGTSNTNMLRNIAYIANLSNYPVNLYFTDNVALIPCESLIGFSSVSKQINSIYVINNRSNCYQFFEFLTTTDITSSLIIVKNNLNIYNSTNRFSNRATVANLIYKNNPGWKETIENNITLSDITTCFFRINKSTVTDIPETITGDDLLIIKHDSNTIIVDFTSKNISVN